MAPSVGLQRGNSRFDSRYDLVEDHFPVKLIALQAPIPIYFGSIEGIPLLFIFFAFHIDFVSPILWTKMLSFRVSNICMPIDSTSV